MARSFPEISGNFVPLPHSLLDVLLLGDLSREETLVTLYMGRATYAFDQDRAFIGLEQVAKGTGLALKVAQDALARAIERGTVLPFATEGAGRFFLLNTDFNRRVANVLEEPQASEPVAAQSPVEEVTPRPGPAPAPPVRGVSRKVLDRIVSIIGRDLTRDETERLADLKASGELLLKAIDNLVAKHVEIYSSDQVIYEYESIASAEKRRADEAGRRERAEISKQRTRTCKKCNGLGYNFIGINTIKECECRKS